VVDQQELIKEVYARYGLAYYHSEVLHRGLCIICALATFQTPEYITAPRVKEKLAFAYSLTLGQVLDKTKTEELFPSNLQLRLDLAKERRNYLAHRFWFERIPLMFSEQGLIELCQELLELSDLFSELDQKITEYFEPKRKALGITDELIQEPSNKIIVGEADEVLILQRLPKKQERLIKAWDVKIGDNVTTQIFETEDGCLWQFCDNGLGWTCFKKPAPDWKVNEFIQKFLPANINPRPPISAPWNFEFALGRGAVLWVKRGKNERTYTWDINASKKK
jgi:hypothetical protein